jgi:toxin ParE1/3/4
VAKRLPRYRLSRAAGRDIEVLLEWGQDHFGEKGRLRYEALLAQAVKDVVADPDRAGSHSRPELAAGARTYHLRFSRDRVQQKGKRRSEKVRHPRHFLLYRTLPDGRVEIGRVLHDSVDLERHLPEEYKPDA